MYANSYLKIAERLDQELNKPGVINVHGKLNFIARFNDQFNTDDQEHAIPDPAILIQFLDTQWKSKSRGIQDGTTVVVIYVGISSIADDNYYSPNKEKALLVDAYMDIVHKALQGLQAPCLGSLNRVSSNEDSNHDHKFVQTITYQCIITDESASKAAQLEKLENVVLDVVGEPEIVKPSKSTPFIIP